MQENADVAGGYEGMQTNAQVTSGTQSSRGFAEVQVKYLMSEFI